jgi:hypothetical protein
MFFSNTRLKPALASASLLTLSIVSTQALAETAPYKKDYKEPTRGFFIEHGLVAGSGRASVELHTGSDDLNSGGGIRLGLPNSELILNSGFDQYDTNELLLKWALPRQNSDGTKQTPLHWAVLAGISHTDFEFDNNADFETTSLKAGLAISVKADAGLFTVTPKLIYASSEANNGGGTQKDSDTFFEVDLGAYVGLIDTEAGLFSAGIEAQITTQDNRDNTVALGMRWSYNEKLNLDIVPVVFSDSDLLGIPGLVRLNMNF